MKDEDILKTLKQSYEKITPNDIDQILFHCDQKEKENFMEKTKKKSPWWIWVSAMATIVLVVGAYFGYGYYDKHYRAVSVIAIDVNPSITLKANKQDKIIEASALNEDGKKVLEDINLKNVDFNIGMNALIGSMLKNGYIDELKNSILVTVENHNHEKAQELQNKIISEIDRVFVTNQVKPSILSQIYEEDLELQQKADAYEISVGKAKLIEEMIDHNPLYQFDDLVKLTVHELNLLATSKKTTLENVHVEGSVSEGSYIGKQKAKSIALSHANVKENVVKNLEVEFDYEDGKMVYDVDFDLGTIEYDYEIDALTGAIVKSHKEEEKPDEKDPDDTEQKPDDEKDQDKDEEEEEKPTAAHIGVNKAKTIAFRHAGILSKDAQDISAEFDYSNGKAIYEVEFETETFDFDYQIDALSGSILYVDKKKNQES